MERGIYEMYTKGGDRACFNLVNRIKKKIQGKKRVTTDEIEELVYKEMDKVSKKHGEIYDTEPRSYIYEEVDAAMEEMGYQRVFYR